MAIFSVVFLKTVSVFLCVIIGFLGGKYSNIDRNSIATLLFYFITPIVFFSVPASTVFTIFEFSITFVLFIISTILGIIGYYFAGMYWQDSHRNIVGLSSGTANAGYFTLPIATAIFDDHALNIYMMAIIGIALYEASIGFYICVRSLNSTKDSIVSVIKLPILHGFGLGCIMSQCGFSTPHFLDEFVKNMRGSYSILGMIMVGLGISKLEKLEIDIKFTGVMFATKFLFYPIVINIFILFDRYISHWYNEYYYNVLQLVSLAPIASNVVVVSSLYKMHPSKVATTVFLSLLFVIIYMPSMSMLFLNDIELNRDSC
ncbi:MAG: AEC family transporter [Rickettsiaceae bacterium]